MLQFIDDKVQQMHINNLRKLYCVLLYALDHVLQKARSFGVPYKNANMAW
jgi:hypothetical protein